MHALHRTLSLLPLLALLGCPAASAAAPGADDPPTPVRPPSAPADDVRAQAAAMNAFGLELFRVAGQGGGDVLVSPPSAGAAFAMTWAGAKGRTADQLAKALHQTLPPERAHPALGAALGAGQTSSAPVFAVANRLWGAGEAFVPGYLALTRDAYSAELGRVDFAGDPEGAREQINAWVAKQTRDRIQELLAGGTIDSLTRLVLTNAVYFKGAWKTRFDADATREDTFTLASGERVTTPLMNRELTAPYHQGEGFALVELPYEGERFAMVVIVPARHDGLPALEASLEADALTGWLAAARPQKVQVTLPRLKIEAALDLVPVMQALGVTDLFDQAAADLSGMGGAPHDLYAGAAVQKAFVEVNEEGTEAAAATAVVVQARGRPEPSPRLRADRPFLFMIRDRETGMIWFMGRETDPRS